MLPGKVTFPAPRVLFYLSSALLVKDSSMQRLTMLAVMHNVCGFRPDATWDTTKAQEVATMAYNLAMHMLLGENKKTVFQLLDMRPRNYCPGLPHVCS